MALETLADLLHELGDVPLDRIRLRPPPGTATEDDVVALRRTPERRLSELVEGVLIEKAYGCRSSVLSGWIIHAIGTFLEARDLGVLLAGSAFFRLRPGLVRTPDLSYLAWERLPGGKLPDMEIADLVPDLAVEVLSTGDTPNEMRRKRSDYFQAGTRLFWVVDPETRTAEASTTPEEVSHLAAADWLDGGDVLPGFTLPLSKLFARLERPA
jgi:Uma2 family endonuclease